MQKSEKCMNVLIWGAGEKGRRLCNFLKRNLSDQIVIKGFVDVNYELIKNNDSVYSPQKAKELYTEGIVDAIIPGTQKYYDEVCKQIVDMGIKLFKIKGEKEFFLPVSKLSSKVYEVDGIKIYEVKNIYVEIDNVNGIAWLYNKAGILNECFNCVDIVGKVMPEYPLVVDFVFFEGNNRKIAIEFIGEDVCVLYRHWSDNYWHFVFEVFDKILLLEKGGYKGKYLIRYESYAVEYLNFLGIKEDRVIWIRDEDDGKIYFASNLYCPERIQGFENRTTDLLCEFAQHLAREICQKTYDENYPKRIYVKRIGTRRLTGAEDILRKYGFEIIIPEELSVAKQISYFANADIVISPHGANSTNVIFMKKGSVFIETFGKNYIYPCCLLAIKKLHIDYRMFVERHVLSKYSRIEELGSIYDDYMLENELLEAMLASIADDNAKE